MAITIDADPTSAAVNSYATVDEAKTYHEGRLHNDAWKTASNSEKVSALVWATRVLDTQSWSGVPNDYDQPLDWPRAGVRNEEGQFVGNGIFPVFLKNAVAELAFLLIVEDRTVQEDTAGFNKIKLDVLEVEINGLDRKVPIPDSVHQIIKPYLRFTLNGSGGAVKTVRT